MFSAYVQALRKCPNWDTGNKQASVLAGIDKLTPKQIDELVTAYNETRELHGSFGFNGTRARFYGPGLVSHLNRLDSRIFMFNSDGNIVIDA